MDRQEPFRVAVVSLVADGAEAWRVTGLSTNMNFVEWVRKDPNFDGATVLSDILFEEMCRAGCFAELSTLSIFASDVAKSLDARGLPVPSEAQIVARVEERQILEREKHILPSPEHKVAKNYSGPFQKLAWDFEDERVKFSAGKLRAREYIARRVQLAVARICGWIRDGELRASGIPVRDGREDRAREMRPREMAEHMTLGAWDGLLYQGPDKGGPAWKSVYVSWGDFLKCAAGADTSCPTTKAEKECRRWLRQLMTASPDAKPRGKDAVFSDACARFSGLSRRAFDRAWAIEQQATGARWSDPGRPSKSPH